MHQIAPVQERNHFYARRKNITVQLLDFLMNALERHVRARAFAQECNPRNDIVVVNNRSVFAMNRPGSLP